MKCPRPGRDRPIAGVEIPPAEGSAPRAATACPKGQARDFHGGARPRAAVAVLGGVRRGRGVETPSRGRPGAARRLAGSPHRHLRPGL